MLGVVAQMHGRDHRAGREGRRVPGGVPGVPQRQRDGLDLHPLQVAGVRAPGLHADVHAGAAAQGLRPRAGRRPRARRADAGRRGHRAAGAGDLEHRPGGRGFRDPAGPPGRCRRPDAGAGGRPGGRRARDGGGKAPDGHRSRRPPAAGARPHGRRLRDAGRLRPAAGAPARPRQGVAGGQRLRRVPAVRLLQHPLHHADLDRRRARRQDDPVRAADPGRRARTVGLRLGGAAPQAVLALAADRTTAGPGCSGCAERSRRPRG